MEFFKINIIEKMGRDKGNFQILNGVLILRMFLKNLKEIDMSLPWLVWLS